MGYVTSQRVVVGSAVHGLAVDDELGHGVGVHVAGVPHAARDLLVLHQRQEHRHELRAVRRRDRLQHLRHKISGGVKKILNGNTINIYNCPSTKFRESF